MIHIHPNWETVEDVPVHQADHRLIQHGMIASSRLRSTAAIVGILTVIISGYLLYSQLNALSAQISLKSKEVHITSAGMNPSSVSLTAGSQITWVNDDTKPHILSSETLETNEGFLYTSAIFPQSSYTVTLSESIALGDYTYISLTDPTINGVVTVHNFETAENVPSVSPNVPPVPAQIEQMNPPTASIFEPLSNVPPAVLPQVNPFALGFQASPESSSEEMTLSIQQTKPFRQPETGTSQWIIALASAAILSYIVRRACAPVT